MRETIFTQNQYVEQIDSDFGYTEDNVVACCFTCNSMKSNRSAEEFVEQCKKITENLI